MSLIPPEETLSPNVGVRMRNENRILRRKIERMEKLLLSAASSVDDFPLKRAIQEELFE